LTAKTSPVIAVLDEDSDDRLLLTQAFCQCRQDIQILAFDKEQDLLEYLSRQRSTPETRGPADLIIVGLHVPWENTSDLIATVRSDAGLRQIPIIVFIGPVPEAFIKGLYDLGVSTVITRPVLWDELVNVMKKICDYWFGPLKM
jgi:CheY-like chemotaxis protein